MLALPQRAVAKLQIMRLNLSLRLPVVLLCFAASARAAEENLWPFTTQWSDSSTGTERRSFLGPIGFDTRSTAGTTKGVRPLILIKKDSEHVKGHLLYPFLNWESSPQGSQGDFFNLVRWANVTNDRDGTTIRSFEVWPFYLGRETGNPETSYRALFPIAGTVKNRFSNDRIDWIGFPLYGRFERRGVVTTTAPWPFIKHVSGAGTEGFEFWPFFGSRGKKGEFKETFAIWPLYHHNTRNLPDGMTTEELAVLPFYSRSRSETAVSETYLWPFFGYTLSDEPRYREQRWLWPLFVTARGEDRHVDRWAPFYTFSDRKGVRKTWVLWPLFRHQSWAEAGLEVEKRQVLFFLYWNLEQRSASNPKLKSAHKTHLWPLFSHWDNGAGHTQFQVLSPLEVFFQHNDVVRTVYSPLFSLYRLEHRPSGDMHASFLFDLITYHREGDLRQFNLGPLLETRRDGDGLRRITLLKILPLYSRGPRSEPKP